MASTAGGTGALRQAMLENKQTQAAIAKRAGNRRASLSGSAGRPAHRCSAPLRLLLMPAWR
jgi:hypothetical protein